MEQLQEAERNYQQTRRTVMLLAVLISVLAFAGAMLWSKARLQNVEQQILAEQREKEQLWADRAVEAMQLWRDRLLEQVSYVSRSDEFRLFVMDVQKLGPGAFARYSAPGVLENESDPLYPVAETLAYLDGLLQDHCRRRGWTDARIVAPDGSNVVCAADAPALPPATLGLVRRAAAAKSRVFGPVYEREGELWVDLVDTMEEVLGEDKIVGFLLVSVPVNEPLTEFLASDKASDPQSRYRVLVGAPGEGAQVRAVGLREGKPVLGTHVLPVSGSAEQFGYARRRSVDGDGDAWSLGKRLAGVEWFALQEKPAALVDAELKGQAARVYTLGALGSVGLALLFVTVGGRLLGGKLRKLNNIIRQQKQTLDNVNASIKNGLLLIDMQPNSAGQNMPFVRLCNPAFAAFMFRPGEEDQLAGAELVDIFTAGNAVIIDEYKQPHHGAAAIAAVLCRWLEAAKTGSLEIRLGPDDDRRLYRMEFYRYAASAVDMQGDCVAIFTDITKFRRRSEENMENLAKAIVRALDGEEYSYLRDRSDKLEQISALLGESMGLSQESRETLQLASRLSQMSKIFVPRELVNSTERFDDAKRRRIQMAPYYAYKVLKEVPSTLPVAEVLYQMGGFAVVDEASRELRRLDVQEMRPEARILLVINDFCAMVGRRADRVNREPLSLEEAAHRLEDSAQYDNNVVAALKALPADKLHTIIEQHAPQEQG